MININFDKLDFSNSKHGINVYWYDHNGKVVAKKSPVKREYLEQRILETPENHTYKIVLECSTVGDIRFSAFGAKVKAYGLVDIIEFFYQLSKGFEGKNKPKLSDPWHKKNEYVNSIKGKSWDYFD